MKRKIQDICATNIPVQSHNAKPSRSPIYPAVVYECESTDQADQILGGKKPGFVYQRDGHPNANSLAEKVRQLHTAEQTVITSSGMSATALGMISQLQSGDHVVFSDRLYGGTTKWIREEASRLGITASAADFLESTAIKSAIQPNTKMLVAETISNPLLRVIDLRQIADIAHENDALLLVDNTFASPVVCQPLELGADLVVESMTKVMNGHSDVTLGALCGHERHWARVASALSIWGWTSSPMDCWLAERGLATLFARLSLASQTAKSIAKKLVSMPAVDLVSYPGCENHPDHAIACKQFGNSQGSQNENEILFSHLISFRLAGGSAAVDLFVKHAGDIAFCPTLGELTTAISHPFSTSHRGSTTVEREKLGIFPGTIRLSIGLESPEYILEGLSKAIQLSQKSG